MKSKSLFRLSSLKTVLLLMLRQPDISPFLGAAAGSSTVLSALLWLRQKAAALPWPFTASIGQLCLLLVLKMVHKLK